MRTSFIRRDSLCDLFARWGRLSHLHVSPRNIAKREGRLENKSLWVSRYCLRTISAVRMGRKGLSALRKQYFDCSDYEYYRVIASFGRIVLVTHGCRPRDWQFDTKQKSKDSVSSFFLTEHYYYWWINNLKCKALNLDFVVFLKCPTFVTKYIRKYP